jgi:probable phosphoglycerate mutase
VRPDARRGLGEAGNGRRKALARRFACEGVDAVWTSPLQRARETAEPVAARLGLAARPSDALCEIDFGAWTGQAFDALRDDRAGAAGTRPAGANGRPAASP